MKHITVKKVGCGEHWLESSLKENVHHPDLFKEWFRAGGMTTAIMWIYAGIKKASAAIYEHIIGVSFL